MVLEKLYEYIGTFETGKIYTIAARPGMGKTLFAKRIEQEIRLQGKSVQYIDTLLDTHAEQISECGYIEYAKLMDIDSVEWEIKYSDADIIILDSCQRINRYYKRVDFMLKRLAKKYNKAIIVLCNIPRKSERKKNKRPQRRDMRGNYFQALWKKSDVVIFLYREYYYDVNCQENLMEVHIAKNDDLIGFFTMDFIMLLENI